MQVADQNGKPRARLREGPVRPHRRPAAHGARQAVQRARCSASRRRPSGCSRRATSTFQGTGTRLGDALDRARDELSGLPVAGLVIVSDGADNSEATIDESIAGLKAQAMPVFSVGVGRSGSRATCRSRAPRRRAACSRAPSLVVDVVVTQVGYAGAEGAARSSRTRAASSARRTSRCRPTAKPRRCTCGSRSSEVGPRAVPLQDSRAGERRGAAEQPARRADRRLRHAREDSVPRRRAAARGRSSSSAGDRRATTTCRSCCSSARRKPA